MKNQKFKCMACEDTGKNSKGYQCSPCLKAGRVKLPAVPKILVASRTISQELKSDIFENSSHVLNKF